MRTVAILLIVLVSLVSGCRYCREEQYDSFQSPMSDGERIAVQKLDALIRTCPHARKYTVFWKEVVGSEEMGRRTLIYEREGNVLGQELDPGSGYSGPVLKVDDARIHALAQKGGSFADLAQHAPRAY